MRKMNDGRGLSRREFLRLLGVGAGAAAVPSVLASCDAFIGGGGEDGGGSSGGALSVMTETTYEAPLEAVLKEYEKQNRGVEVKASYANTEQLMNTLRTQLASGTAPDMLHAWPGLGGNAMAVGEVGPAGYLADLSDQAWSDKVPETIRSLLEFEGKTVMFSPGIAVIAALYYKPIFDDLDLEVPGTWSELLSACEEIKKAGKYPFAVGNKDPVFTQLMNYALVPSTVFSTNPDFAQDHLAGRTTFAESGWREAFEKYVELEQRGYFNPNQLGTSPDEAQQMFFSGEAAMYVVPIVSLPTLEEQYDAKGKIGAFVFPGVDDPSRVWLGAAAASGWAANAQSERLGAAKQLISYFGELQTVNTFAEMMGFLPIIPNDEAEVHPELEPMLQFFEDEKYAPFPDQRWPSPEVQQTHFAVVQQVFTGEISIDEALKRMEAAFDKGRNGG
jgi:raffinose/stachyose/melibiose transport system substrate-binding protein